MRVLMSAYACEPNRGSEPEVGWRWVCKMSKHHDIVVLTRSNNRQVIESYLRDHPDKCRGVSFVYFDLGERLRALKKKFNIHELYYILWQRQVRKLIDEIIVTHNIDIVHLVTFASFRYPVFLSNLSVPVVWGPVGGAEIAPWPLLFYRLRFPALLKEVVRNVSTQLSCRFVNCVDPTATSGGCAIASTPRTLDILNQNSISATLMPAIGVSDIENHSRDKFPSFVGGVRFIFVGRLVLLKGVHLLLEAFAKLPKGSAMLSVVGDGPELSYLRKLSKKLNIDDFVDFVGFVHKDQLAQLYTEHHVLVAPSLYESGGFTVLESFQHKRPAIVMDVGGLAMSVEAGCGIKVNQGCGTKVVKNLAKAMSYYINHPDCIQSDGENGYRKLINDYSWEKKTMAMSQCYKKAANQKS